MAHKFSKLLKSKVQVEKCKEQIFRECLQHLEVLIQDMLLQVQLIQTLAVMAQEEVA
jgi:hypothetical protein